MYGRWQSVVDNKVNQHAVLSIQTKPGATIVSRHPAPSITRWLSHRSRDIVLIIANDNSFTRAVTVSKFMEGIPYLEVCSTNMVFHSQLDHIIKMVVVHASCY